MQNARLDEAQAEINTAGKNISNLRYAEDTTLMAESEEELKSLLMKVKDESEKVDIFLDLSAKTKEIKARHITAKIWNIKFTFIQYSA